jgi:hypothetical protein
MGSSPNELFEFFIKPARDRKERHLVPQASAGYLLSTNPLLAFRKAQRGREKNGSEK